MNKKTKTFISIVAIVLTVLLANLVYGVRVADSANLDITLISQESDPVEPGEIVDLRFKIENRGGTTAEKVIFEFIEEYPFSEYVESPQRDIGTLQTLQNNEEGVIVLYTLKVDEEAVEKTYYVDARYKIGEHGGWNIVKDFPIRVRTRDLVLSVESIKSTPETVDPGKEFELSLTLRNNADSLIKDITVNLDLSEDDTPFAPSTSISEKQIYQINSKTAKLMKFDLVALPDAEGGIYKIPITLTYNDETGETYTKEDIISLKVSSISDLLMTIDSSEINEKQKSGIVIIKIVNRGLTNIKLASSKLGESEGVKIKSEPEIYVGNIDSDDYETVEYEIQINTYDETVKLPIELTYRDSTNKQHKETTQLVLKTYSKGRAATIISKIISIVIYLAIIVGIVFGVKWVLHKRKKKKRQG